MRVKLIHKKDFLSQMQVTIHKLQGKKVNIGVFGEQAWLAGIHEYGCEITPKNTKYLTVPCHPKAKGKRASDFPDLFFMESKKGTKFLARPKGKNSIEIMFVLMTSVKIPERAFLRTGHDNSIDDILKKSEQIVNECLDGKISEKLLLKYIGLQMASAIKDSARDLQNPVNHWTTQTTKGSSNLLIDTGDMIGAITYKVDE